MYSETHFQPSFLVVSVLFWPETCKFRTMVKHFSTKENDRTPYPPPKKPTITYFQPSWWLSSLQGCQCLSACRRWTALWQRLSSMISKLPVLVERNAGFTWKKNQEVYLKLGSPSSSSLTDQTGFSSCICHLWYHHSTLRKQDIEPVLCFRCDDAQNRQIIQTITLQLPYILNSTKIIL